MYGTCLCWYIVHCGPSLQFNLVVGKSTVYLHDAGMAWTSLNKSEKLKCENIIGYPILYAKNDVCQEEQHAFFFSFPFPSLGLSM